MENERKSSGMNIGSASIIMVFSVLCLTVFAVLSLVTANSEYKLAVKSADVIKNYYSADAAATEKLVQVKSAADMESKAKELGMTYDSAGAEGITISFAEPVTDTQELSVCATFSNGEVSICEWRLVSTHDWNEDTDFWDGEF